MAVSRSRRHVSKPTVPPTNTAYHNLSYEVTLGILIGSILGFSVRKVMKFCERKNLIDRQSFVAQYVSLAVLSIGELASGYDG